MSRQPKIILWDVETTPIKAYSWSLYPKSISHPSIVEDWSIICGAWKELGKGTVHAAKVDKVGDDYELVQKLRDVVASADAIVHHNGDKFDLKKLNARLIFHGLEPLPKIRTVDTLKEAKKIAAFSSNRLDYLAKLLCGKGKIHVEYELWLEVLTGSKKALKQMLEYNKVDVIRLEDVYLRLRPYMKAHPNVASPSTCNCPKCNSDNVKKHKPRITAGGIRYQQYQCNDCGGYFQAGTPLEKPLSKL